MTEHYCQFIVGFKDGRDLEGLSLADNFYDNDYVCCGAIARFQYLHFWLCAEHYDTLVAITGELPEETTAEAPDEAE